MNYFYAKINAQRRAFSVTQVSAEMEGRDLIQLENFDESVLGKVHNQATGKWESEQAAQLQRRVSVLAFRRRFTSAERAAIEWAAVDRADQPSAQRQQAAALRATLADQAAATFIDLDDADTAEGVQALEAMGLIAAGRAATIIGAPVQPQELPRTGC